MEMKRKIGFLRTLVVLFIFVLAIKVIIADPYGADALSVEQTGRANFSIGSQDINTSAQAGNVTQLGLNTSLITKRWQGYYGNISGTITLDDASGNTLFDWNAGTTGFSPVGNIFASNGTVSAWNNVDCFNFTDPGVSNLNLTIVEDYFNMASTDGDGIDTTFSGSNNITIGSYSELQNCPATRTYNGSGSQTVWFNETLLTDNLSIIFATEVETDVLGFDDNTWDFQMIVGEDGDNAATTTYFFYVELS